MAGSEKSGCIIPKAMILENAYFVLTHFKRNYLQKKMNKYEQLVSTIHALPIILDYKEHDYNTGTISHLPHIIAATGQYVRTAIQKRVDETSGCRRFKRYHIIASLTDQSWQHICLKNKDNISQILASYIKYLGRSKEHD